ncbi:MAG: AraC family transcriptional regulator [Ruminiclostridium sp.]|nr:AraC family transcriptional regulator [Ruminiclostridium sp.]
MDIDYARIQRILDEIEIKFNIENLFISVDFINIQSFAQGMYFDYHMHSNYEFHYIVDGKGVVNINGKEYNLEMGDFYLTGPGIVHAQFTDDNNPMFEYALKCSIWMEGEAANCFTGNECRHIFDILRKHHGKVVKDSNSLRFLFEKAFEEVYLKKPWYYMELKNIIFEILVASARNIAEEFIADYDIPRKNINNSRMEFIKSFINDNVDKVLTADTIAQHLFLSTRQLARIVKEETGCSIHEYIMLQKVEKVRKLLGNPQTKLHQIAEMTGFSSEFHLSSAVKKWGGKSPGELRKEIKHV